MPVAMQAVKPWAQLVTQRLPSQVSPARHAAPHDPQFAGSRVRSEQVRAPPAVMQVVSPPVQARLGDVALVTHADVSFDDPADSGPFQLQCRHGSLTAAEVYVPVIAATS